MPGLYDVDPNLVAQSLKLQGVEDPELYAALERRAPGPPVSAPAQTPAVTVTVGGSAPQPAAQPTPAPEPSVLPVAETNRALEVAGYDFRVPAPFNPNQSARALRTESTAGKNDLIGLKLQEGEIKAEGYDKQAAAAGALEIATKSNNDTAQRAAEENRGQKRDYERQAHERLTQMVDKLDNPPDRTMEKVWGIISAVLAIGGNRGAATGAQLLGEALSTDARAWAQSLEADSKAHDAFLRSAGYESDDSISEARVASQLNTNLAAQYEAAFKKAAAETGSKEAKRAALEAATVLRNNYVDSEIKLKQSTATARQQNALETEIARLLVQASPEEQRVIAAGYGPIGDKVLKRVQERDQTAANTDRTRVQTEKDRKEAERPAGPKTEGEMKRDAIVQGLAPAYQRLSSLVAAGDQMNRGATKETWLPDMLRSEDTLQQRADIKALAIGVLRAESGANIPEHEIEAKFEAHPVNSGDPEIRAQGLKDLINAAGALDNFNRLKQPQTMKGGVSGGLAPTSAAGSAPSPSPAAARVSMFNPETGEHRMVLPSLEQQYARQGFVRGRPSAPAAPAIPRDDNAGTSAPRRFAGDAGVGSEG